MFRASPVKKVTHSLCNQYLTKLTVTAYFLKVHRISYINLSLLPQVLLRGFWFFHLYFLISSQAFPSPKLSLSSPECKMCPPLNRLHGSLIDLFQYLHVCYIGSLSVILVSQGLHPPLQMWPHLCWAERKNHLLLPAGNAFPKADQFGKVLASSFTAVVKTTVTGFRKRTWVWNCLTCYASKLIIYTTVHFQNYKK